MTNRKKPGWAFWTVVVVVLVVYPLSMGPASWLGRQAGSPFWLSRAIAAIYQPLWWIEGRLPQFVSDQQARYLGWWIGEEPP
jgi:hypothetical protein